MNCPKCGSYYVVRNGISLSNLGCCSTPNKDIEELQEVSVFQAFEDGGAPHSCKNRLRKNIKNNQKNFMFKKSRGKLEVDE